ncbi:glycosyltransferase family 4 protein [Fredinandcohnia sp. 179-A 10B2 NHS]|uniref:glycosyltransferase family 4 protein n=1 Tax=Fredinandcohnia sp. 179-A 10B2 NHS TaxID=3235176 RepID=UPI0039A01691
MGNRIKILHVTDSLDKGGLEEVIYNLVKNTNDDVFDVRVAYFRGGDVSDRLKQKGFICYEIKESSTKKARVNNLAKLIDDERIDIIQTHFCLDGMLAAKKAKVKLIETTHNTYQFFVNPWGKIKYSFYLNLADRIVSVSESVNRFNKKHFLIFNKNNCISIRNSIDSERLIQTNRDRNEIKKELGLPQDSIIISTLSRIDVQKGLEYFIEVAKRLNKEYKNLYFLIPGTGDAEYTAKLKGIAQTEENILFLGHVEKVNELFKVMDIYVMSSLWEGAPLTLLEAMAYGKAVVVTDVGNTAEVIDDRRNGFLVTMKDIDAMVSKIKTLLNDENLKKEMEKNAAEDFQKHFSNEIMIEKYKNLYKTLLK